MSTLDLNVPVGIVGIGTYFPATIETAADLVARTGIPEAVLRDKMGIRQRHIAGDVDTVSYMASCAAQTAIADAGIDPAQIRLVISHGSEHKDHLVWNAAAKIQQNVGAVDAFAFEVYALCAGAALAIQTARGLMLADPAIEYALLAAASRENDLVDLNNPRTRFMVNFGAGGGALILQRGAARNRIVGMAAFTDGSLSEAVILTHNEAEKPSSPSPFPLRWKGSRAPAPPRSEGEGSGVRAATTGDLRGKLDVVQPDYMTERLNATSLANFVRVIRGAVENGGGRLEAVRFLGITHMKRSFYLQILAAVGLTADQSVYLEDYGHIQSVDQALLLQLGLAAGKIKAGDLIVLAGAGVGYTWSAVAIQWG